jgi:peroxiredoxin
MESHKGAELVFLAVNQGEDKDKIQKFFEKEKLICDVAMDKDSVVSNLFGVDSIPRTFLIGKDGIIEAIHVGFVPDLKEKLSSEVDKLLKGEKLFVPSEKDKTVNPR